MAHIAYTFRDQPYVLTDEHADASGQVVLICPSGALVTDPNEIVCQEPAQNLFADVWTTPRDIHAITVASASRHALPDEDFERREDGALTDAAAEACHAWHAFFSRFAKSA